MDLITQDEFDRFTSWRYAVWKHEREKRRNFRQDLFKLRLKSEKQEKLTKAEQALYTEYVDEVKALTENNKTNERLDEHGFPEKWDVGDPMFVRFEPLNHTQKMAKRIVSFLIPLDSVVCVQYNDEQKELMKKAVNLVNDLLKQHFDPLDSDPSLFFMRVMVTVYKELGGEVKWL